jgi:hypothetical protein
VKGVVPPARLNAEQGRAFCVAHLLILSNDLAHCGIPCEIIIVDSCIKPQTTVVNKITSRFTFFAANSDGFAASDTVHSDRHLPWAHDHTAIDRFQFNHEKSPPSAFGGNDPGA